MNEHITEIKVGPDFGSRIQPVGRLASRGGRITFKALLAPWPIWISYIVAGMLYQDGEGEKTRKASLKKRNAGTGSCFLMKPPPCSANLPAPETRK